MIIAPSCSDYYRSSAAILSARPEHPQWHRSAVFSHERVLCAKANLAHVEVFSVALLVETTHYVPKNAD